MISSIQHRGPDGYGIYIDGSVGLAHARLSIIDVDGGSQPMATRDECLWITFNGEIFNYIELREELIRKGHSFATRSDTEVILHLYREEGEKCVNRLNGQWAFAIWDAPRRKLFLSRDRVGVRPLFYTQAAGQFLFSSEIKALLVCRQVRSELDLAALDEVLTFWVAIPPRTSFQGICQVPPGHSLSVENGCVRLWRYWRVERIPAEDQTGKRARHLADELLHLLQDATRIRLRADVPIGAYLSGGLDSTIITALARQLSGDNLKTFSISFSDAEFDESSHQREASRYFNTRHDTFKCGPSDIGEVFTDVVWHAEQPLIRTAPAPLYLLARLVHNSGFKVVLTGEGADEILGGYDIFKETKIRTFVCRRPRSSWRSLLLQRLYPYMVGIQRQPQAYLSKFFQATPEDLQSPFFSHLPRWQLTSSVKQFLSDHVRQAMRSYSAIGELERSLPPGFASAAPFSRAEYLEAEYLLPGYILSSQGDRMAMAHAVEGRYPFLDHRVVEFAAKLPLSLKMKVLEEKHLLKRAVAGLVPESIRTRVKQPYRAPDGASFFSGSFGYVEHMLSSEHIQGDGVFDSRAVAALVRKFQRGHATSTKDNMALVAILSTEILLDLFLKDGSRSRLPASQEVYVNWLGPRSKYLREQFA